jgi:hypothetical protein
LPHRQIPRGPKIFVVIVVVVALGMEMKISCMLPLMYTLSPQRRFHETKTTKGERSTSKTGLWGPESSSSQHAEEKMHNIKLVDSTHHASQSDARD